MATALGAASSCQERRPKSVCRAVRVSSSVLGRPQAGLVQQLPDPGGGGGALLERGGGLRQGQADVGRFAGLVGGRRGRGGGDDEAVPGSDRGPPAVQPQSVLDGVQGDDAGGDVAVDPPGPLGQVDDGEQPVPHPGGGAGVEGGEVGERPPSGAVGRGQDVPGGGRGRDPLDGRGGAVGVGLAQHVPGGDDGGGGQVLVARPQVPLHGAGAFAAAGQVHDDVGGVEEGPDAGEGVGGPRVGVDVGVELALEPAQSPGVAGVAGQVVPGGGGEHGVDDGHRSFPGRRNGRRPRGCRSVGGAPDGGRGAGSVPVSVGAAGCMCTRSAGAGSKGPGSRRRGGVGSGPPRAAAGARE